MRTKTPAVKRRPSNSIPPSNASVISSPLLYQDEANEEYHVDGNDNRVSEDTGSILDDDNNNNDFDGKDDDFDVEDEDEEEGDDDGCGVGIAGDYDNDLVLDDVDDEEDEDDNVVVPDFVDDVNESAGVNCIFADWLGGEFSYSCKDRSGQVLVCNENGCSIAVHEVCMNTEPEFDDTGKFYCPYCWYKREVARTKELRREALLAKRELLNFIHLKQDGGNKEKQEDGADNMKAASLSTRAGKKNSGDCENGLNDDANETIYYNLEKTMCVESIGKEKIDGGSISKAHGFDNVADGQIMQEEDIENTSDSENDGSDEDPWRKQPYNPNHFEIVNDTLYLSTKGTSNITGVLEDNQVMRRKEEPVLPNAVGSTMTLITQDATSKVPAIESFEFVSPDLDTGALIVRQKRIKHTARRAQPRKVDSPMNPSFQPNTSAKDKKTNQQGKATTAKNSVQCLESTKQIMTPKLGNGKRRRLHWTTEEEDMLKEGVRRFSLTRNKNIPWRKILEFGRNVFGNNRIPVDLKDKWKKIMAKEDPKSNKGALIILEE